MLVYCTPEAIRCTVQYEYQYPSVQYQYCTSIGHRQRVPCPLMRLLRRIIMLPFTFKIQHSYPLLVSYCTIRVIYKAPRSRVRVDTAGEDEAEPQARPSTSQPDPPVHGDEGPYINRVVWSEMNATASGLYVSTHVACRVSAQTDIGSARSRVSTDTRSARSRVSTDTRSAHRPCMLSDISTRGATP